MSNTLITDTVGVYVEGDSPREISSSGVAWPAIIGGAFAGWSVGKNAGPGAPTTRQPGSASGEDGSPRAAGQMADVHWAVAPYARPA